MKTLPPPDAPVYPEEPVVSRTSPVPEKVSMPLFWNVLAAMDVAEGIPMFSEKTVTGEEAEAIVTETLTELVPAEFVAKIVTVDVPAVDGVPEINPFEVLTVIPVGNPVALKEVGLLFAAIW